jgi:hypothetical protein
MSAINTTTMPLPISGWLRVASGCATTTGLAMLLNGVTLLSRRAHLLNHFFTPQGATCQPAFGDIG